MSAFSLDEQIAEVQREIAMRESLYRQWVQARKMTGSRAERQIGCMQAVLETLRRAKEVAKAPA